ncbi:AAR2 protein-domain-containing protein [Dipodascopsis tothii]|uniref:AAR2 protein-domain-containing protein n=1 Tax=Dipodascopsis tothii TaxID=44089 RepID=UPI0034CF2744
MPPRTTVVLNNIPDQCLLGIDLQFFTSTPNFNGIKLIPNGIHVLHWSPPVAVANNDLTDNASRKRKSGQPDDDGDDEDSLALSAAHAASAPTAETILSQTTLRMATFFEAAEGDVVTYEWKDDTEEFVKTPVLYADEELQQLYPTLLKYPKASPEFSQLTSFLPSALLLKLLPKTFAVQSRAVSSTTPSSMDSLLLDESLRKGDVPNGTAAADRWRNDSEALQFLTFDTKKQRTWREGAVGREVTAMALDRSWFLGDLVFRLRDNDLYAVLGEFQLAFVLVVVLANYSAAEQWKRLLELLCTCRSAVVDKLAFFKRFLDTLLVQLECVPDVYFSDLLGPTFVQTSLVELRKTLANPYNRYVGPADAAAQRFAASSRGARAELLAKLAAVGETLQDRFDVDIEVGGQAGEVSASKKTARFAGYEDGHERMHHYGSDDEEYTGMAHEDSSSDSDEYDSGFPGVPLDGGAKKVRFAPVEDHVMADAVRTESADADADLSGDSDDETGEYAPVVVELDS